MDPLRRPNPWLQFNRDDRQDKEPMSLKDAKSDIPLGFLLPTPAVDVKPHFILITLVYKTTYFILSLYVISLCVSEKLQWECEELYDAFNSNRPCDNLKNYLLEYFVYTPVIVGIL